MKHPNYPTFVLGFILLLMYSTAWSASTKQEVLELQEEVKALQDGQQAIQKDLAEIKKLLEAGARPSAPSAPTFEPRDVSIAGASLLGQPDAKVTLIEYSDYQCPFCARHAQQTMPELMKNYIDEGNLKFVMREFPIPSLHPRAQAASEAALCARDQDKYWEMHDVLFQNQRSMSDENLRSYGAQIGLDATEFNNCLEQGTYTEQVEKDIEEGRLMGVRGTPSFVIGLTDAENPDNVRVLKFIRGAQSYNAFKQEIDKLLASDEDDDAVANANP